MTKNLIMAVCGAICLTGCSVGYNSMVVATKTNVGIDVDTIPATAELGFSRTDGVLAPQFPGNRTIPVITKFTSEQGLGNRLGSQLGIKANAGSSFAIGRAATEILGNSTYSGILGENDWKYEPWLSKAISALTLGIYKGWMSPYPTNKNLVQPYFFGTDSVLGLKIKWAAQSPVPTAVSAGYNRKELAWVPISAETTKKGKMKRDVPPLLTATTLTSSTENLSADINYVQYFATGEAAVSLAQNDEVRNIFIPKAGMVTLVKGERKKVGIQGHYWFISLVDIETFGIDDDEMRVFLKKTTPPAADKNRSFIKDDSYEKLKEMLPIVAKNTLGLDLQEKDPVKDAKKIREAVDKKLIKLYRKLSGTANKKTSKTYKTSMKIQRFKEAPIAILQCSNTAGGKPDEILLSKSPPNPEVICKDEDIQVVAKAVHIYNTKDTTSGEHETIIIQVNFETSN